MFIYAALNVNIAQKFRQSYTSSQLQAPSDASVVSHGVYPGFAAAARAPYPKPEPPSAADDVDPMQMEQRSTRSLWNGIQISLEILSRRTAEVVPQGDRSHILHHQKRVFEEMPKFAKAAAPTAGVPGQNPFPGPLTPFPGLPRPLPGSMLAAGTGSFPWAVAAQQAPVRPPQLPPPPRPMAQLQRHAGLPGLPGMPWTLPSLAPPGQPAHAQAAAKPAGLKVETKVEMKAEAAAPVAALSSSQPRLGFGSTVTSSGPAGARPPLPPPSQQAMQAAALSFAKMQGPAGEAALKAFFQSESH